MYYGLIRRGSNSFHPIDENEFLDIKNSKEGVIQSLFIEEKFDLVIENFIELENALLESTTRQMVLWEHNWQSFQREREYFNRRFINLLSAGRTYVDQEITMPLIISSNPYPNMWLKPQIMSLT